MNLAVVGCGYWGKNLVRNFYQLGVLKVIVEQNPISPDLLADLAPGIPVVTDLEVILKDSTIDAVVIATPAITHSEICKKFLLANKHVFCEKPLALNYSDAKDNVELAKKMNLIFMVGHILEYHPAIRKIKSMIDDDVLGDLQYIYSNRLNLGKIRKEENILWSFAPHDIAVILRLVDADPLQIMANGGNFIQKDVADVTITQMDFSNGVKSHIFISWLNPFKEQKLVVIGNEAMISFNDVNKELILHHQKVEMKMGQPIPVKGEGQKIDFDLTEPLKLECQAFLQAIAEKKPPLTDGESGLRVLKVLQAANLSLNHSGKPVIF